MKSFERYYEGQEYFTSDANIEQQKLAHQNQEEIVCEHCEEEIATVHELCWECMVELHGDPFDV